MLEFATEEEAYECLGEEAKAFNVGYGWAVRTEPMSRKLPESIPEEPKGKIVIAAYFGNSLMYVSKSGGTTFTKAMAKQFDDCKSTDTKISMMNRRGNYKWQKISAR